jgi:hypothetical protein
MRGVEDEHSPNEIIVSLRLECESNDPRFRPFFHRKDRRGRNESGLGGFRGE